MEAMPPFGHPSHQPIMTIPVAPTYNAATCHPVFFSQALRKPPFPLPVVVGAAQGVNPVAFGYVAEGARRVGSASGMGTKL